MLKINTEGYINRLAIFVGVTLGIRTTALHELELHQFEKIEINNTKVWRYTGGRGKEPKYKPVQIDIYNSGLSRNRLLAIGPEKPIINPITIIGAASNYNCSLL